MIKNKFTFFYKENTQTHLETNKSKAAIVGVIMLLVSLTTAAQQTSLDMVSEPGDYIGQGQTYEFDENDGTFTASTNFDDGVTISFNGPPGSFTMNFAPKQDADFIIGPYPGATRFPFQSPRVPGLSATGFGRGCNQSFGEFTVLDVMVDGNDDVVYFAADFVQHCESIDAPALSGEVRFNITGDTFPPVPDDDDDTVANTIDNCISTANLDQNDTDKDGIGDACDNYFNDTFLVLDSEQGDYIGQGQFQELFLVDGTLTADRNFDNGVTIRFNGADNWTLDFAAPNEVPLAVGSYEMATRFPFQDASEPGLSVSGAGRGCNTLTGRFDILTVEYNTNGDVESFIATFEQHCSGAKPALFGEVRYDGIIDLIFADDFED
ncbi:hypothetical protein OS175_12405 [Marinicella sp. S1101]|uniref:hypothetical protein n=1 Tax=Marinicella marina TaxID=2996016 RepID=UPI002260E00E|nr:hypothetical protein [Marinicella marina]MCX7554684.1 hypothetical protein [Marinicella marina]MDJ1140749.1 hypothetical protein [Marinicella marina]